MNLNINMITYVFLFLSHLDNFWRNFNGIIFFILNLLNYRIYQISSKEKRNLLFKTISKYSYFCNKYDENKDPIGLVIHQNIMPSFIIFYKRFRQEYVSIICKKDFYEELEKDNRIKGTIDLDEDYVPVSNLKGCSKKNIKYITKTGEYGYFQYGIRNVNLEQISKGKIEFFENQQLLFKNIMQFYKSNHYCKVYLSGEPGSGKTYFAYLTAQKLNCYLCDVYNGNEPSNYFNEIYARTKVNSKTPIILIFDEVDKLIEDIHINFNQRHKKYSKEIYNKTSWNSFLDKIEYGMYPYVILIMTSNQKRKSIDKYDPSYLREGRINIIEEW